MKKYFIVLLVIMIALFMFSCMGKTITVTSPNGGEQWIVNNTYQIEWDSENLANVDIKLIKGITPILDIATDEINNGSYEWTIPSNVEPGNYKIKVIDSENDEVFDESNDFFTVPTESLMLTLPNGGEVWGKGSTQTIRWESRGNMSTVKLELFKDGAIQELIASNVPNLENYRWENIPTNIDSGSNYKIKITYEGNSDITDESDEAFSLFEEQISITAPVSTDTWGSSTTQNNTYTISWTDSGISNVDIELWKGGVKYADIAENEANNGSYEWTIPDEQITGSDCQIRINDNADDNVFGTSDLFIIYSQDLAGIWQERPNDGYQIEFLEEITKLYTYNNDTGTYDLMGKGIYTYSPEIDMIGGYATHISPDMFSDVGMKSVMGFYDAVMADRQDSDGLEPLPYTFTATDPDSGMQIEITIQSAEIETSFVIDPLLGTDGLGFIGAYLGSSGSDTETLIGEWTQTTEFVMVMYVQLFGEMVNDQSVIDKYEFGSNTVTYTYYEPSEDSTPDNVEWIEYVETAQWAMGDTSQDIKTFTVSGASVDNERLVNGTYKYRIIDGALMFSRPDFDGETAEEPMYIEKLP